MMDKWGLTHQLKFSLVMALGLVHRKKQLITLFSIDLKGKGRGVVFNARLTILGKVPTRFLGLQPF